MKPLATIETPEETVATPWGNAVYLQRLDKGAVYYATQNYGGLGVTKKWAQSNLTVIAKSFATVWRGRLWYGKEKEIYIVTLEHPQLFGSIFGTKGKPKLFEAIVKASFPTYFDVDYINSVESEESIPTADTLQQGDEITIRQYGSPDNVKHYRFVAPYGKQQKAYVLIDDINCVYKLSLAKLKPDVLVIQRGDEVLWERP